VEKLFSSLLWNSLTQDTFDQSLELQAELWSRLTRIKVTIGDIHGAQRMAEKCLAMVTAAMKPIAMNNAATAAAGGADKSGGVGASSGKYWYYYT
jgi:hypothetical protein